MIPDVKTGDETSLETNRVNFTLFRLDNDISQIERSLLFFHAPTPFELFVIFKRLHALGELRRGVRSMLFA